MKAVRSASALLFASAIAVACSDQPKQQVLVDSFRVDTVAFLRSELAEQTMQASMFVNEVNKELAKARSLSNKPKQLLTTSELIDVNEERNQVLARVAQLVERLEASRGRIAGMRKEIADKDSAFALRIAAFEQTIVETQGAAERQRVELQGVIDGQTTKIAALTGQLDTLTSEHNAVYVVMGTKKELVEKGVLVQGKRKRFLVAGQRSLTPAPDLNPTVFTKLDRRTDSTILLPDGVYKIVSRQNGAAAVPQDVKDGGIVGGLTIEDPERFWNTSRYLILVRS
jgi:hypothetical protein